jgi:Galactose oxidase, central domain
MPMRLEIDPEPRRTSLTIGEEDAATNTIEFTITLTGDKPVNVKLRLQIPIGDDGVVRLVEHADNIEVETPGTAPGPAARDGDANTKELSLGAKNGVSVNEIAPTKVKISIGNILCLASETPSQLKIIGKIDGEPEATAVITITKARPTAPKNPILTDNVLSRGWHPLFPLGKSGSFPSTIFDSSGGNSDALYAIFMRNIAARDATTGRDVVTGREAVLCKSVDGVTGWQDIGTDVPEGMESSPGVRLGNRLWLIGGSAVDPDRISDSIWHFDVGPSSRGWQRAQVEGFEAGARMGHSCVVVNDSTIWVLGGRGKYGKSLNDVWGLTIPEGEGAVKAEKLPANFGGKPRCMFSALKHDGMIWVLGGVSAPNGKPLSDGWNTSDNPVDWKDRNCAEVLVNPIGTGAATCGGTLFTVTSSLEGDSGIVTTRMRRLTRSTTTKDKWEDIPLGLGLPLDPPWSTWRSGPRSIAVVGFQKERTGPGLLFLRYLHWKALDEKTVVGAPMFVYVNA